jgi:hypothetical protein
MRGSLGQLVPRTHSRSRVLKTADAFLPYLHASCRETRNPAADTKCNFKLSPDNRPHPPSHLVQQGSPRMI